MQFFPGYGYLSGIHALSTTMPELRNTSTENSQSRCQPAGSYQPIPQNLQDFAHPATVSRGRAGILSHDLASNDNNNRNQHRNYGLHSPAHPMSLYPALIAGRSCRAVKSGSGFLSNRRDQSTLLLRRIPVRIQGEPTEKHTKLQKRIS
jgi:hypothetical protein